MIKYGNFGESTELDTAFSHHRLFYNNNNNNIHRLVGLYTLSLTQQFFFFYPNSYFFARVVE